MRLLVVSLSVAFLSVAPAPRSGAALAAMAPQAPASAPHRPPDGSATVRGTVLANDTGQPLRRAAVYLSVTPVPGSRWASAGTVSLTTSTDAAGAFEFTSVPAGLVTVHATKDGYYDPSTARHGLPMPGARRRAPQPVAGSQALEKIVIALSRAGAIVGRVVDEFGDPAPSIAIEVLTRVSDARRSPWQNAGRRSESDDTGAFRVWGLAPGEYLVAARPRQVDVKGRASDSPDREGYAPTYYPGTASVVDAARVVVRAGRDAGGLTFPLLATRLP